MDLRFVPVKSKANQGKHGIDFVDAQATFDLDNEAGTQVGFWTPSYARTITAIAGTYSSWRAMSSACSCIEKATCSWCCRRHLDS
jgi:alpha-acetolactate decarboxylase